MKIPAERQPAAMKVTELTWIGGLNPSEALALLPQKRATERSFYLFGAYFNPIVLPVMPSFVDLYEISP